MQKLVTAEEMKAADAITSTEFGVHSLVLMERAALSAKTAIEQAFPKAERFLILCGVGNNGGDGLALARLLFLQKREVQVILMGDQTRCSDSYRAQLYSVKAYGIPCAIGGGEGFLQEMLSWSDVVVDALLGVGVNRDIQEPLFGVIEAINGRPERTRCVSLDLPTGIHTDTGEILGTAVRADLTVTFAFAKLGLVRFPGCELAGEVRLADAGIPAQSLKDAKHLTYTLEGLRRQLPKRERDGNKGSFGKVLIVAGSKDMAGAALLSARGVYGVGAGMVKLVTSGANRLIVQTALPEAMLLTYEKQEEDFWSRLKESVDWADSLVVGPGLSTGEEAMALVEQLLLFLQAEKGMEQKSLVLDADALNLIVEKPELRKLLQGCAASVILTPHPGELARLTGRRVESLKREPERETRELRRELANAVLVCKDSRTYVFAPAGMKESPVFVNTLGNDGMATAGSGDVLAGILGGICALEKNRVHLPEEKREHCWRMACLGVAIHGAAGDLAAEEYGKAGMLAGNIAEALPRVMSGGQSVESMVE